MSTQPDDAVDPIADQLIAEYESGVITRRTLVARGLAAGLSLPAIGALLAACGSSSSSSSSASKAAAASVAEQPGRPGGTFVEGYDMDFSTIDPIDTSFYDPSFMALYEAVVAIDQRHGFTPQLAESWTVSPDGRTWTFKVKPDAVFHSGAPVTADAIAVEFNAIINPKFASPQLAQWSPIITTTAVDAHTFVMRTQHPFANLLNVISTGYSRICNMRVRQSHLSTYGKTIVDGSGPFAFQAWVPGDHVSVTRWDGYPGSITPFFVNKGKAYLDGITWKYIPEQANRAVQIETGELDAVHGVAPQDVARLKANPNLTVIQLGEQSVWYLGLNFERLDFADLRVRQAISHAIDRNAIVDKLVFGYGTPAFGPLPESDPYYNTAVETYNQFNLAKAKSLMAAAGWKPNASGVLEKDGKTFAFTIVTNNQSFTTDLASVVQAELTALGMDVKVSSVDQATQFSQMSSGVDAFLFKYLWPNPYDVYIVVSVSKAIPFPNWQRARIPAVDAAAARYQSAATVSELEAASRAGQVVGADLLPFVPLFTPASIWVTTKKVRNYIPISWNLYPYYNDVWLTP